VTKTDGVAALILEATAQGFDVTIRIRRRDDDKDGELKLPSSWAERLGYEKTEK
jgi:hypothetical protein